MSSNGSERDAEIAQRVQLAYAESLAEHGFSLVALPEDAYWSAFALVRPSERVDPTFGWAIMVMATQDLWGHVHAPISFAYEGVDEGQISGFMLMKEVRLVELALQARRAAEDTARALLPHTSRMCVAWKTGPRDGVATEFRHVREKLDAIERLRQEIAKEIRRARQQQRRKQLDIQLDSPS